MAFSGNVIQHFREGVGVQVAMGPFTDIQRCRYT